MSEAIKLFDEFNENAFTDINDEKSKEFIERMREKLLDIENEETRLKCLLIYMGKIREKVEGK